MTLNKYNQKRNFDATLEPRGDIQRSKSELFFVVQKHAATNLHYDFRLEMEGVLKSWAVPKGPSMNPEDKRLAMMVEDHPYTYKDFEGNIPAGNYGAGNVIVWDHGTYTITEDKAHGNAENDILQALKKGHLSIILHGEKLKGEFSLVKMIGKQENAWLLFKKSDSFATNKDILKKNKSVISNKTLESLEKKHKKGLPVEIKKSISNKKATTPRNQKEPVKQKEPADFISPMLAEITHHSFDDQNWVFENKYDGYRTIAVINPEEVHLYSRNHLSFDKNFSSIRQELQGLKHTAVLDGEVVIQDANGRSDFQLLQNHLKTGGGTLCYYVFDILNLDGNDIRNLTLLERKELLKMLLSKYNFHHLFYSEHVSGSGKSAYEQAVKDKMEGIMAKRSDSPYRSGRRSSDWLKIKIVMMEEAIIVGITEPRGARSLFGAILLARYEGKELKFIGKCGTGFDEKNLKELHSKFKPEFVSESPFAGKIKLPDKVQWLRPRFVCQVKFTEWTQDGHLRHPVYLGLRIDKNANEVTLNANENTTPMKTQVNASGDEEKYENNPNLKIGKINLQLTNQNKIYFPEDGISKGDIITYYRQVSDVMLPYLKDRPQSLNRFPNGINAKNFYHKDMDIDKIPKWLKIFTTFSDSNKANIDYLLCNDTATLLYMANLGCIEINPWNSTIKNIENPDWVVIDLDPEKIEFQEVVKTALVVKEVLDEMDIRCYCKTSGATGLHIFIPLAAQYNYHTAKIFAELVAHVVNERLPKITSIVRSVQQRQNRVYIDFLQNNIGQTLAAPYSVRPRPGATVSTPLDWDEVNEKLTSSQFTIKNIPERIKLKGDLWKPILGKGVNLEKIINNFSDKARG